MHNWWKTEFNVTKENLMKMVQSIVSSYQDGVHISDDHKKFMLSIFSHHRNSESKFGCGVKDLVIRKTPAYGSRCFFIIRNDGTEIDISAKECIYPSSHTINVTLSAREEIQPQINMFKHNNDIPEQCELCECGINKTDKTEVDHIILFSDLFNGFLQHYAITIEDIEVEDHENGLTMKFKDRQQAKCWFVYHQTHATLRHVHAECNRKRKK